MIPAASGPRRSAATDGFAVILVLWLLVLLAAIGMHLVARGRSEAHIAFNATAAAEAEALADAGVARAVFGLSDPNPATRWRLGGPPREIAFGNGRIAITLRDENGKVNLNLAPEPLLAALFRQVGANPGLAARLAAAITARVRPGAVPLLLSSDMSATSTGDGTAARKPPLPFDSIDDLADLPGMSPELLAAVRPYVSVYATSPQPLPAAADPLVIRALTDVQPGIMSAATENPGGVSAAPAKVTAAITSAARSRRGGAFVRDAVVRIDPTMPTGYVALRWARPIAP
jgi:general secretion pathway protein K